MDKTPRLNHFSRRSYSIIALFAIVLLIPVLLRATREDTADIAKAASFADADVNRDGTIDFSDAGYIRETMVSQQYVKQADLNHDTLVNEQDIEHFYYLYSR